jgi:hypothetical protein
MDVRGMEAALIWEEAMTPERLSQLRDRIAAGDGLMLDEQRELLVSLREALAQLACVCEVNGHPRIAARWSTLAQAAALPQRKVCEMCGGGGVTQMATGAPVDWKNATCPACGTIEPEGK